MKIIRYTSAGGVVIDQEKMLLLNRPALDEVRLPKGHVDPGESIDATALREVTEESGYRDLSIVCELDSQVVEFDHDGGHIVRTEHYFLMHLHSRRQVKRSAKDEEQFRVVWAALDKAAQLLTFESERSVAARAVAAYRSLKDMD